MVIPVYQRRKTIEDNDELDELLTFAHFEAFEIGFGIADRIEGAEVSLKLVHKNTIIVFPVRMKTFQNSGLKPFKGGASKVSKSVRDLVLVGSEGFAPISEVKFALNLEVTKLLRVLTVEGIRLACFGFGFGRTVDGLG